MRTTQAARTHGIDKRDGDIRHYTGLKSSGRSMYVKAWIDPDSHVMVG
jgi:hypothetical protein